MTSPGSARGGGLGPHRSDAVVGVLALQGGFEAHAKCLSRLDVDVREVRTPEDLEDIDALVIPGGESTTIGLGVEREGLGQPLVEFIRSGKPVLGTCAGMIMLDREHLGVLDIEVRRNAFGRQLASFETELLFEGEPLDAVFIRAPWVEKVGEDVEILAEVDGHPVAVRQGNILAVAFHPELGRDLTLHQWLLDRVQDV
ncbi:MAG TPA: pyridoxal 5'-phosphate synthase glutaminase subunit PdxT [Thermoleophilaceae bacterium]|nr:pyridoxal 5'-phosphate synthase glutaminase subunit PdxT [Thermoleophilaceae bacterium]